MILFVFISTANSFINDNATNSIRIQEAKAAITYHQDFRKSDILKLNGKSNHNHNTFTSTHYFLNQHPDWLKQVNGTTSLNYITLPGSHESCTRIGGHDIICQSTSILEQLTLGIRFFDLHLAHVSDIFLLYHDTIYQQLTFQTDILDICIQYLRNYPSETIIFLINEETQPTFCTRTFEDTLLSYVDYNGPVFFYLEENLPTLDEIRGKIVIFRRFDTKTHPLGNQIKWKPDSTFSSSTTIKARVQDESTVLTLFDRATKLSRINQLFMEAQTRTDESELYFNFLSGSGRDCPPMKLDQYIKPAVIPFLQEYYINSYCGIILMDFVEQNSDAIIQAIIDRNVKADGVD